MHETPKSELRASNGARGDARAMAVVVDVDASGGGGVDDGAGVGAGGHGAGAGVRGANGGFLGSSGREPRAFSRSFGYQARETDDTSGGDKRDGNAKKIFAAEKSRSTARFAWRLMSVRGIRAPRCLLSSEIQNQARYLESAVSTEATRETARPEIVAAE